MPVSIITDYLVEKAEGMLNPQQEIRDEGKGYMMFDDGGVEISVGEFLYGMVRILKPERILETGTYTGISAMYMGQALKDNGVWGGHLITLEIDEFHKNRAEELWRKTGVIDKIQCNLEKSLDFEPSPTFRAGLLFLDSEPNLRFHELVKFYPILHSGGYVFIHDTPPSLCQGNINPDHPEIKSWPFGNLPQEIKDWVKDGDLVPFHFPNPRGTIGFYKPKLEDYKWR